MLAATVSSPLQSCTMKKQNSIGFARYNRPFPVAVLATTIAAVLLAACGGGGDAATSTSTGTTVGSGSTQPATPVTPASVSLPQALFELNYPQVLNTDYLSVTTGTASKASAAAASPAPVITPTELLDWAEAMFPARFPAGAQNQTSGNLTYRYYPATQRYLGVANNVVYAFGADTANRVVNAGNLGDFNCSVKPGSCTVIPVQAFTCDTSAITCVEVVSTAGAPQSSVPVTFGQPFKAGDWKHSTQGLVAKVDGTTIPLQADEISSHRDGSARFAVLSAQLNNLAAGQTKVINLYTGAKTSSTPNVTSNPDWNLEIEAQLFDAAGNATDTLIAQPQSQLVSQIATGTERRLGGAVASEYTVALPFKYKTTGQQHPHLSARLHTRLVDGGARIRTDMVIENTRTWTPAPGNITYSLAVKRNGSTLFTQPKFTHYHHARWHKVIWTGSSEPQARVRHNMPYFVASKAVWNYNLSLSVPESVLSSQYSLLAQKRQEQAALGPMGNVFLTPYFPQTGGRAEIGPLPRWTALYLVSQDSRMLEVMLANADAAASVPIHYRDDATNSPIDLDRYPNVAVRIGTSSPALPAVQNGSTIWSVDVAHQGSFAYVPYLITGDAFYLEEGMFWAAWNLAANNPEYRGYGAGLVHPEQLRGQAWSLRSIREAARMLPDQHPMKAYFQSRLDNNLSWYLNTFPNNPDPLAQSPLGAIQKPDDKTLTGPWQNDFMGIVFAQLIDDGETTAKPVLDWFAKFNVGRFLAEPQGFCTAKAPGYYWKIRDTNGNFFSTWKSLFDANHPGLVCDPAMAVDGYPDEAVGYAAGARASLATAIDAGVPNAAAAYARWLSFTPRMENAFNSDPTWAIVPRQ